MRALCAHACTGPHAAGDEHVRDGTLWQLALCARAWTRECFFHSSCQARPESAPLPPGAQGVKRGDRVWQIAFGSGFKCNSAVWRARRAVRTQHEAWLDRPHPGYPAVPAVYA